MTIDDQRTREFIAQVRSDYVHAERLTVRRKGEAAARALLAERAGAFTADDCKSFARLSSEDLSPLGRQVAQRWGPGISQPQINNWVRRLPETNRAIAQLWSAGAEEAPAIAQRLLSAKAPGGLMLFSLVLYLKDPDAFSVMVATLLRGAIELGAVPQSAQTYAAFNQALQAWRRSTGVDPAELDIILSVADPERTHSRELPTLDEDQEKASESIPELLERILGGYLDARQRPIGSGDLMWGLFDQLSNAIARTEPVQRRATLSVRPAVGQGNWSHVPWVAILDSRHARSTRDGVYCVYLFRRDMTGVYLTLNQGVQGPQKTMGRTAGRELVQQRAGEIRGLCGPLESRGFQTDDSIDLRSPAGLGADYEESTIASKLYESGLVPEESELVRDLDLLLSVYDEYLTSAGIGADDVTGPVPSITRSLTDSVSVLEQSIQRTGFVFQPWQIAAYVTAIRTKPFVILAGVSGTGKSRLPALVAESTGGECELLPVRPDWTDSSDLLGYVDLENRFRPGPLLRLVKRAAGAPDRMHFCVLDEMNLGRVEHYFAEALSAMEDRRPDADLGYVAGRLVHHELDGPESIWASLRLVPNFAVVGTVNMDESAHGFSRKVIDRAFTLELSEVELGRWNESAVEIGGSAQWPARSWFPRATRLGQLRGLSSVENEKIAWVIDTLGRLNAGLREAQLQVGYRSRDEIALFVLHALDLEEHFVTDTGTVVEPLDLALHMKVLPRISGGSTGVRHCLLSLLGTLHSGAAIEEPEARRILDEWRNSGRPEALASARFPMATGRLCLMWERLQDDGFTSYWL